MTGRDEGGAGHGVAGNGERDRHQIEVQRAEIGLGPADPRTQQRKARAGGDTGRGRDVPRLIEKEPGQIEPVEADDGARGQDRGDNQVLAHATPRRSRPRPRGRTEPDAAGGRRRSIRHRARRNAT